MKNTVKNESIIKVSGLSKEFGEVTALKRCSMEIKKGEIFGYLGPSGAGKTTTLKLLTGQLHSDEGDITVLGENPFSPRLKQRIGIMSDMSGLYEKMTVYENLELFAEIYGIKNKKKRIARVLDAVELGDAEKKKVVKLSRGMKQRLVFARTILHQPELLFLDEPTANLDPATAEEVRELMRKLNRAGTTIFLTTHNMEEADELCDRIAFLNQGAIVECGTPKDLKLKYAERKVVITAEEGEKEVALEKNAIVDALRQTGKLLMIHSEEPSLKEVFLKLTREAR